MTARRSSKSQGQDAGPAQKVISPDLMRAALERVGGCLAILAGPDLRYLFVNAAYQALVPGLAMVGRTFAEVFPHARIGLEAAFRSVLDTGEPRRIRDDVAPATGESDATWDGEVVRLQVQPGQPPAILVTARNVTERARTEAALRESEERLVVAAMDISERKRTEDALRESEEQFRRAIEDAPIPMIMHAEDGQVLQISRTWTELTGYCREDMPTFDAWLNRAYGDGADAVRDHMQALFMGVRRSIGIEFPIRTRDGETRHWSFSASAPGMLADGRRFVVGMAVDITERLRAEESLRAMLADRDALLRELHHRVKNNLQVITSLLEMHSRQTSDAAALASFSGACNRVAAIASIHELLYQSESFSEVDLAAYARRLVRQVGSVYDPQSRIDVSVSGDDIRFDLARAVPFGLLLNELVSNTFKHAFRSGTGGELRVELRKEDGDVRLHVRDNGVGLRSGFDDQAHATLGLHLVRMLAKQLGGSVTFASSGGTSVEVRVPIKEQTC